MVSERNLWISAESTRRLTAGEGPSERSKTKRSADKSFWGVQGDRCLTAGARCGVKGPFGPLRVQGSALAGFGTESQGLSRSAGQEPVPKERKKSKGGAYSEWRGSAPKASQTGWTAAPVRAAREAEQTIPPVLGVEPKRHSQNRRRGGLTFQHIGP